MKKVILLACLCCTLFSCEDVEKKAGEKLQCSIPKRLKLAVQASA